MNNLKKLQGAKTLSKQEQQVVKGGKLRCRFTYDCPMNYICIDNVCMPHMQEW